MAFLKFLRTILHRFPNTPDVIPIFFKKLNKKVGWIVILHRFPRLTDVVPIIFLSRGFPLISPFRLRAFFILFALRFPTTTPHHSSTAHCTTTAPHQHHTATAPYQHRRFSSRGRSSTQPLLQAGASHQHCTATAQHRRFSSRDRSSTQPLLRAGVALSLLLRAATPFLCAHPLCVAALRSTQLLFHLRESRHHSRSRSPLFEQRRRFLGVPPPLVKLWTAPIRAAVIPSHHRVVEGSPTLVV